MARNIFASVYQMKCLLARCQTDHTINNTSTDTCFEYFSSSIRCCLFFPCLLRFSFTHSLFGVYVCVCVWVGRRGREGDFRSFARLTIFSTVTPANNTTIQNGLSLLRLFAYMLVQIKYFGGNVCAWLG